MIVEVSNIAEEVYRGQHCNVIKGYIWDKIFAINLATLHLTYRRSGPDTALTFNLYLLVKLRFQKTLKPQFL
jgi:hypothetical protein